MNLSEALSEIPATLRDSLVREYNSLIQSHMAGNWTAVGTHGGKFCEIVYTVLNGSASGKYDDPKPRNMIDACKALESQKQGLPGKGLRILIPRLITVIYEVRSQRGMTHATGEVNPNRMDANMVVSAASWVLAELIRAFHQIPPDKAEKLIYQITEMKIPMVWNHGKIKRVLKVGLPLREQIVLLLADSDGQANSDDLLCWTEYANKSHFRIVLRQLHKWRVLEYDQKAKEVILSPLGVKQVVEIRRREGGG